MAARRFSAMLILGFAILASLFAAFTGGHRLLAADEPAHGYDVANLDRTCKPCDDFYQFAVGGWLKNNPIPPEFPMWGSFITLADKNEQGLHGILETAAANTSAARGSMDELPAIVRLPVGKRNAGQHAIEGFEKIRLSDVDLRELRTAYCLEISVPGKVRGQGLCVRDAHLVVDLLGIAALHIGHGSFREGCLNAQNSVCFRGGLLLRIACQNEHLSDVLHELLTQLLGFLVMTFRRASL